MKKLSLFAAVVVIATATSAAQATDAVLNDTHVCCGQCLKVINKVLPGKIKGITDVAIDREKKSISFKAEDARTARRGLFALRRAGFGGKATVDGKALRRKKKANKERKADKLALRAHICCGQCIKAIAAAVKGLDGVEDAKCDKAKNTVTLTGKDINVAAAVAALNKAGFSGFVPRKRKPKKKD